MFYTTLNKIRKHSPCCEGWRRLLTYLGKTNADDEPLSFKSILDSNGLDDAIWALISIDVPEVRLFAVRCVRQIQHLLTDEHSLHALDVSEAYAVGEATKDELSAAWDAAGYAARAAAWDAARAAAWAAARDAARAAALAAARDAAWYAAAAAARDAARDAARAAAWYAAWDAARDAAWYAAEAAARDAQQKDFIAIFCSDDA